MSPQAWGAIVGLIVFAASATFYAGYLTHRVKSIEDWRLELRADFMQLMTAVADIRVAVALLKQRSED